VSTEYEKALKAVESVNAITKILSGMNTEEAAIILGIVVGRIHKHAPSKRHADTFKADFLGTVAEVIAEKIELRVKL
jgi:hypothetical protein